MERPYYALKSYGREVQREFLMNFENRKLHFWHIFFLKRTKTAQMNNFKSFQIIWLNFLSSTHFWSSESIPADGTAVLALLHPKMETIKISPQSLILTQISLFDL